MSKRFRMFASLAIFLSTLEGVSLLLIVMAIWSSASSNADVIDTSFSTRNLIVIGIVAMLIFQVVAAIRAFRPPPKHRFGLFWGLTALIFALLNITAMFFLSFIAASGSGGIDQVTPLMLYLAVFFAYSAYAKTPLSLIHRKGAY